jgi:hypothetical protein
MADPVLESQSLTELRRSERLSVLLGRIKSLAERHFPAGPVDVELDYDPEVPTDEFIVLSVTASGSVRQIVDHLREWRRQVHRIAADEFDMFRISVRDIV